MSRPRLIFLRRVAWPASPDPQRTEALSRSSGEALVRLRAWQPRVPEPGADSPFYVGESRGDGGEFPEAFAAALRERVPHVETVGASGAYLDLTGCDRILPDSGAFLSELALLAHQERAGTFSAGEAGSRLTARLAAAVAPAGSWWKVENPRAFLEPFPLRCLTDEHPQMVGALERMGLRRLGELAAMPADLLRQALGDEALLVWREARGEGRRVLADRTEHERVRERHRFENPESDPDLVGSVLVVLADRLAVGLRALGLAAGRLELHARFHGGARLQRQRSLDPPTASLTDLRDAAERMWEGAAERRTAVASCELRARQLRPAPAATLTLDFASAREDLAPFITRVRDRFGDDAVRWSPELWMDQENNSP